MTYIYRSLTIEECDRINEINPSQYIKRAWRKIDGTRQLVEIILLCIRVQGRHRNKKRAL